MTFRIWLAFSVVVLLPAADTNPGSLWTPGARLGELASDLRARNAGDLVTILVEERASALARGTTKTARSSSAKASVTALAGIPSPVGALTNLAGLSGQTSLDGQGETSRETLLTTRLTARVVDVLPNGNLLVEGTKTVTVNSEKQTVVVRGMVRSVDVSQANTIASDQIAALEIVVNGKGVIGDATRRPNILYRILLGILPF